MHAIQTDLSIFVLYYVDIYEKTDIVIHINSCVLLDILDAACPEFVKVFLLSSFPSSLFSFCLSTLSFTLASKRKFFFLLEKLRFVRINSWNLY